MTIELIKEELDGKIFYDDELLEKFPNTKLEKNSTQFVIGEGTQNAHSYNIITTEAKVSYGDFNIVLHKVEQHGKVNDMGPFYIKDIY